MSINSLKIKKRKNSRKPKTISKLRKECTYLWGLVVRERDGHRCQWCGKLGDQPHHIISKAQGNVARFTVNNGITLCFYCHHRRLTREPLEFAKFVYEWLNAKGIDYEDMKSRFCCLIQKLSISDYENIKNNLNYLLRCEKERMRGEQK